MTKQTERLRKQLLEISDGVNAFDSDTVQIKIIERVLKQIDHWNGDDHDADPALPGGETMAMDVNPEPKTKKSRDPNKSLGATKVLNRLVNTDFFDVPRSISTVSEFCSKQNGSVFQTSEISGVLLGLLKKGKLTRQISEETNRYVYLKETAG